MGYFTTIVEETSLKNTWWAWAAIALVTLLGLLVYAGLTMYNYYKKNKEQVTQWFGIPLFLVALLYTLLSTIWWFGMAANNNNP